MDNFKAIPHQVGCPAPSHMNCLFLGDVVQNDDLCIVVIPVPVSSLHGIQGM